MVSENTNMRPVTVQIVKGPNQNAQGNADDPLIVSDSSLTNGDQITQIISHEGNRLSLSPDGYVQVNQRDINGTAVNVAKSVNQTNGLQKTQIVDGSGNVIGSLGGALNVHDADVHIELINRHFIDFNSATENPSVAIVAGDVAVLVADTTGFETVGDTLVVKDASGEIYEHHFVITAFIANTSITFDRPIDRAYTTSATLEIVSMNMAVNGSLAVPIIYEVGPPAGEVWHITRMMISIIDDNSMDDSEFGGLGVVLTNGVTVRENKNSGTFSTLTNWKINGHMVEDMYDVSYAARTLPAGDYGLRGRFTIKESGTVVRLDGDTDDVLQILIQDDLTDLSSFRIKTQGHKEG